MSNLSSKSEGAMQNVICEYPCSTLPDKADKRWRDSRSSSSSFSEGYHSILNGLEEYVFGETRNRGRHNKRNKQGNEASGRRASLPNNEVLTEGDAWIISENVSQHYKELARELKLTEAQIREIEDEKNGKNNNREKAFNVLLKWKQKRGSDATKGCLAFALDKIDRRDIAESLIGDKEFISEKQDQETLILKVQAGFHYSSPKSKIRICEDKNGDYYRLQKLEGPELEKHLKYKDSLQDWGKLPDPMEFVKSMKYEGELRDRIRMAEEEIKQIEISNARREGQEHEIDVGLQLDKDEIQLDKMHELASRLDRLANDVICYPTERFIQKSQIYDLSISLSAIGKDSEERVKRLSGMTTRVEIELRVNKLLERCLLLRYKMQENIYMGSLKDLAYQANERRHLLSAPTQSSRDKVPDESISARHNTVPKSNREQKELEEQIKPQKDPMEKDDDGLTTRF